MAFLKMRILDLGYLDCQYFRIVDGNDKKRMYKSPVSATLIQHTQLGNILYDTGNSPYNSWEYGKHINEIYPVGKFISIEQALKDVGITCADIDILILSHLHFDHCGGLHYFIESKAAKNVIVAQKELETACCEVYANKPNSAYVKSLFDVRGISYRLIQEDLELASDIRLFIQKSHTAAVIGLVLDTETMGTVILTSDTVYNREAWESHTPPGGGINRNSDDFFENIGFLEQLQKKYNAKMIFGHDSEQISELSQRGYL